MEDVTEVIVEPEPGEDDSTSGEPEKSSGRQCTASSLVVNMQPNRTADMIRGNPHGSDASLELTRTDTHAGPDGPSSPGGPASKPNGSHRSVAFFAVFDGHGGREAAQFARDYLWEFMKKQRGFWSDCDREVCSAIRKGFVACHHAMWKKLRELTDTFPVNEFLKRYRRACSIPYIPRHHACVGTAFQTTAASADRGATLARVITEFTRTFYSLDCKDRTVIGQT